VATKKKPIRRATARKPASSARAKAKKPVVAKKSKASATKPARATKKPAKRNTNVLVVGKRPAFAAVGQRIPRRAVFIDVENTSSEDDLFEVIEALNIDRGAQPTEFTAVGNWRAISQKLGRHLATIGAQLVHSAPATGVKDWSDLWIAVAAGCWLGAAQPGDLLEIVSNDRAFDAVGDAAAARGVVYHRLLHKRGSQAAVSAADDDADEPPRRRRSRGGRRRRGGRGTASAPVEQAPAPRPAPASTPRHVAAPAARTAQPKPALRAPSHPPLHDEAHGATRDQIVSVIGRLSGSDPTRWINLDVLEKALKSEGFARPPGSPRLVTRLKMFKDVEVDSHGRARLVAEPESAAEPAPAAEAEEAPAEKAAPKKRRRRRKPSGSNGDAGESVSAETAPMTAAPYADPPSE